MRPRDSFFILLLLYIFPIAIDMIAPSNCVSYVLFILAFIIAFIYYYWSCYIPNIQLRNKELEMIFEHLFISLDKQLKDLNPGGYVMRFNIMRIKKRFLFCGSKYLYSAFKTPGYKNSELEQIYRENQGCCGTALHEREQIFFDSERLDTVNRLYKNMTATQREITGEIKSILSTPIYSNYRNKAPIAILNIDSFVNISFTKFDDNAVQEIASKMSVLFSKFFI